VPIGGGVVTTIAASQASPRHLAVDASALYWTNWGTCAFPGVCFGTTDGSVERYDFATQTVTPIAVGQDAPDGIAVDSISVYWANGGTGGNTGAIMRASRFGGPARAMVSRLATPSVVAVDATGVYFTERADGKVWKQPLCNINFYYYLIGTSTDAYPQNIGLGLSGDNVYWLDFGGGGNTDTVFSASK
jgi:hypothetical protein